MYVVLYPSGAKFQYDNDGRLHSEDGPAIIAWQRGSAMYTDFGTPYRAWLIHGQFHREDGPACEWGDEIGNQYWLFGEMIPAEKFSPEYVLTEKMARIVEK